MQMTVLSFDFTEINLPTRITHVKNTISCLVILGLTLFILNLLLASYWPKEYQGYLRVIYSPTLMLSKQEPISNSSKLPNSLLQYQHYLQDIYRGHAYAVHMKPSEFISVNRPGRPIDLVLVHEDRIENVESHIEQAKEYFHGKVDEIQKKKISVTIKEIGSPSKGKTIAHFVLVVGAAGIGKSTLCWQLCRSWSEGKLQHVWDLVVLVEVRDETTRKATSLYDLLYYPDDKIRESIAQEVQKREGEGTLIIFDGYDELSDDQRSELSVFQKILSNRLLQKATVMVTSRPIATASLPANFIQDLDQCIVVAGFNETDIQKYISLACKENMRLLKDLRSYVSSRPFIFSVMYNPLHCTIVTELYIQYWKDGHKGFAPNTLTELYTTFVLNLLRRSLPPKISANIEKPTDLNSQVYKNLMQLAELAAKGLERKEYIFNHVSCDTLGLLVSVRHIYNVQGKRSAYMFLHLTLQEYMSAFYWSEQQQQLRNFLKRQEIHSITDMHKFEFSDSSIKTTHWPLFLFIAGLNHSLLFSAIMPPLKDSNFFDSNNLYPFCQLLFEAQSPRSVSEVFTHKSVYASDGNYFYFQDQVSLHIYYYVLGYCIANSDKTSTWFVEITSNESFLHIFSDGILNNAVIWNETCGPSSLDLALLYNSVVSTGYLEVFSRLYPFTERTSELYLEFELSSGDEVVSLLHRLSYYFPRLVRLHLPSLSSPIITESPRLQHKTLTTLKLTLPHYNVVFDQLHGYQALKELWLSPVNK